MMTLFLSQQGDAHVWLEPVRPGASGFPLLLFCFFVPFLLARLCCLNFGELFIRAVIPLLSGAWSSLTIICCQHGHVSPFVRGLILSTWSFFHFCQELIGEIDQDGNGSISFNEFVWLMTRFVFVFVFVHVSLYLSFLTHDKVNTLQSGSWKGTSMDQASHYFYMKKTIEEYYLPHKMHLHVNFV